MASTQPLTQLRAELTKHQRVYQNLVKRVDTRNKKYEEEARSVVFTAEQIVRKKEVVSQLLAELCNELRGLRETAQKIEEEVGKLEGAAILLALREAV